MEKQEAINLMKLWRASVEMNGADSEHLDAFDMAIEALSEPSRQGQRDGLISRQNAIDAINGIIDRFERILRDIRESNRDESVCGMCEYDGAYIGQSGDWCNECPGFEKDDCFKLSEKCKKRWLDSVNLPPAQPYTDEEIQAMQDLEQAQLDKAYELGWKEGREALEKEIWEDGRDRVD